MIDVPAGPPLRVLLIGPLPTPGHPVGGSRVHFAETVRQLDRRGLELDVVNISRAKEGRPPWRSRLLALPVVLRTLWRVLQRGRRAHLVFLNTTVYSAIVLATVVHLACKAVRRPLAVRFFGGGLHRMYAGHDVVAPRQGYGPVARWVADRTFLRCPRVYVQVRQVIRDFGAPANFHWLPNTRDLDPPAASTRSRARQLIFLSRLHREKGLSEALDACRSLPEDCHLRVFGPVMPDTDLSLFDGHPRATYGGELAPREVPMVLGAHDLLLFPSYRGGEGYPGVILEAFQCGVPVVAARHRGVVELVRHEENGLLVEPRSSADLGQAIARLLDDPGLYRRLCDGARRQGERFRSTVWYDQLVQDLRRLAKRCGRSPSGPAASR